MKSRVISWQNGEISVDKYLSRYLSILYGPSGSQTDGAYLVEYGQLERKPNTETKMEKCELCDRFGLDPDVLIHSNKGD